MTPQSLYMPPLNAPRHVLYIIDQLDSLSGGAERSIFNMVRLLPHRYRASVVTFKTPNDASVVARFPCPVYVFPIERTYDARALRVALRLHQLIRKERVTIAQTLFETSDLWAGTIAKLSGCPVLISSRRDMGFRRSSKHHLAYRALRAIFDRIHTVSDAVRDDSIRRDGVNPSKTITIRNGIDLDGASKRYETDALRARLGLKNASHVIVDVTTIRYVKGLDILIRTASIVCKTYPQAMFLVIGDAKESQYPSELNALVDQLGLKQNFIFAGGMDNVFPALQLSHVFCHLSRTDGLSNALLEAMACELPCVVSRVGGNPEAVEEGASGFIVPPENPELAADRVITLLRHPDCAARWGQRGREIVRESFSAGAMVKRFVELYDNLLDKPVAGSGREYS
jgi:glycosyltransferase involved in cell wall biosynthesis